MAQFVDTIVPEGARPAVRAVLKHHFWILSLLLPLVLLPLVFAGSGAIGTQIDARRQEIDGKISQVKQVSQIASHPNEEWSKAIDGQAQTVQQEITEEWRRLWESQQALRTWPPELGADFLKAIERLRTNDQLPRPLLQRYQTTVQRLARKLPDLMGVPAATVNPAGGGGAGGGFGMPGPAMPAMPAGPGGLAEGPGANPFIPAKMTWNQADQARIFQSFVWTAVPSTRQVLLAQQHLWVYGMFCELLRDFAKNATGPHDAPIATVEEIAIAQDAAEPGPGGMAENRVFLPPKPVTMAPGMDVGAGMMGAGMAGGAMDMAAGGVRTAPRGMRARKTSGGMGDLAGGAMPGMGAPESRGAAARPPSDSDLLSYAYVDFGGRPLTAEQLVSEPGAEMTHLIPFVLRVVIDQRQIDALLVALAASPIPIDVRQVRINADSATGRQGNVGGMAGFEAMAGMGAGGFGDLAGFAGGGMGSIGLRSHDVHLELRGTVALATKPGDPVVVAPDAGLGFDTTRWGAGYRLAMTCDRRQRPGWPRLREAGS